MNARRRWLAVMGAATVALVLGASVLPGVATGAPGKPKAAKKSSGLAGDWSGALSVSGQKLRLVFHLVEKGGKLSGGLDSLDQGANGIPVPSVTESGRGVKMDVPVINGVFEGKRNGTTKLVGEWRQNGATLPLTLVRAAR